MAGSISQHFSAWSNITSDTEILSTVSGLPIELISTSEDSILPYTHNFSSIEQKFIKEKLSRLMKKGIV